MAEKLHALLVLHAGLVQQILHPGARYAQVDLDVHGDALKQLEGAGFIVVVQETDGVARVGLTTAGSAACYEAGLV